MSTNRDTYRYHFIVNDEVVHRNITKDLNRREKELQRGWPNGKMKQIRGKTTFEAAGEWIRNGGHEL